MCGRINEYESEYVIYSKAPSSPYLNTLSWSIVKRMPILDSGQLIVNYAYSVVYRIKEAVWSGYSSVTVCSKDMILAL